MQMKKQRSITKNRKRFVRSSGKREKLRGWKGKTLEEVMEDGKEAKEVGKAKMLKTKRI